MKKCKIISVKPLGRQKTYNVTMKSDQHNYKIMDAEGNGIYSKNSHSCAYAYIAYQCAWLRNYYPIEFVCNLLTSEINNSDKNEKLNTYWGMATDKMNIKIYKAHLNKSKHEFVIDLLDDKEILRAPLTALPGVGNKAVDSIVKGQPYKNLEDFMRRTDARVVNTRVFSTMVSAGCMDDAWKTPRELLLNQYESLKKKLEKDKKQKAKQEKELAKYDGSLFDEFNGVSNDASVVVTERIEMTEDQDGVD